MNKKIIIMFVALFSLFSVFGAINDALVFMDFENPSDFEENEGTASLNWIRSGANQTQNSSSPIHDVYSMDTNNADGEWITSYIYLDWCTRCGIGK